MYLRHFVAGGESDFQAVVAALLDDISRGVPAIASRSALETPEALTVIVSRRVRLDTETVRESVDDALLRFESYAKRNSVEARRAPGLLRTMAIRAAIDRWRTLETQRVARESSPAEKPAPRAGDVVLAMLDRQASAATVATALRRAMELGRHDLARVVRDWLGLADQQEGFPTHREVAAELGISHTTAGRALSDFAGLARRGGAALVWDTRLHGLQLCIKLLGRRRCGLLDVVATPVDHRAAEVPVCSDRRAWQESLSRRRPKRWRPDRAN